MKQALNAFILFFIFNQVNAQNSQKNPTYVTGELSIGNYFGAELHLN